MEVRSWVLGSYQSGLGLKRAMERTVSTAWTLETRTVWLKKRPSPHRSRLSNKMEVEMTMTKNIRRIFLPLQARTMNIGRQTLCEAEEL